MKLLLVLAFFLTGLAASAQIAVDSVAIENLRRTKAEYVKRWLNIEPGDTVESWQILENVQELKDLNLFFDVNYRVDTMGNKTVLCFLIREARYVYPSFDNIGSSENINFTLGVTDINFLGKGQRFGALYRYYGRHSGKIFHAAPLHKNGKTGHSVVLGSYASVEPLYFEDGMRYFNFDNYHLSVEGSYLLKRFWTVYTGGMYMFERYKNISESVSFHNSMINNGDRFQFHKYQVRAGTEWRHINYHDERREGIKNRLHTEYIETQGFQQPFIKLENTLSWFKLIGERGNLAIRNRIGIATNNEGPFSPFFIDNYNNIRGSGDRVERGTGEFIFNAEYHHSVWDHQYFLLQSTVFTDVGTLREAGANFQDFVRGANVYRFAGIGIRLHSKVLYRTSLRFDYSFNLRDLKDQSFVVGFGQYF